VGAGGYGLLNALVALGAFAGAVASTRRRQLRLRSVDPSMVVKLRRASDLLR